MKKRVVITGMGAVTPLACDMNTTWDKLIDSQSGVQTVDLFDPAAMSVRIAGQVSGFNPEDYIEKKDIKKMARFIQFAIASCDMALKDAQLSIDDIKEQAHRVGSLVGVGIGGLPLIEKQMETFINRGPSRISPFFIPSVITNMVPGHFSIRYGLQGPNFTVTSACASGAHAMGEAKKMIEHGICDIVLTGGSESTICPLALGGFAAMKALSKRNDDPEKASRPFDKNRDGFVLAEAGATFILESLESAQKRNAPIYAELVGYGSSSDAYHMTSPHPEGRGAHQAMSLALKNADISAKKINYVNAHGTSTPMGDGIELGVIKKLFKDSENFAVSSTKSSTGHTLGAAGALESAFCIMALKTGIVPPTLNLDEPDDICEGLNCVPHKSQKTNPEYALNNSFGFGGTNASLIFKKYT